MDYVKEMFEIIKLLIMFEMIKYIKNQYRL